MHLPYVVNVYNHEDQQQAPLCAYLINLLSYTLLLFLYVFKIKHPLQPFLFLQNQQLSVSKSNHLGGSGRFFLCLFFINNSFYMERDTRFELAPRPWKGHMLPLHQSRILYGWISWIRTNISKTTGINLCILPLLL